MEIKTVVVQRKVDLGCGPVRKQGFLRVDWDRSVNPDLAFDLERRPWPLPSNHFTEIYSSHVVEHLTDIDVFLSEAVRIAAPNARFRFEFPHYSVAFIEPEHRRGYRLHALALHPEFKVEKARLEWSPDRKGKSRLYYLFDRVITWLANLNPYMTERVWCYWFGGFSNVVLEGHVDKQASKQVNNSPQLNGIKNQNQGSRSEKDWRTEEDVGGGWLGGDGDGSPAR